MDNQAEIDYEGTDNMQDWLTSNILQGQPDEEMDFGLEPCEEDKRKMYVVESYHGDSFIKSHVMSPCPSIIADTCTLLADDLGMGDTQFVTNNMEDGEWYTIYSQDRDCLNEIDVMEI